MKKTALLISTAGLLAAFSADHASAQSPVDQAEMIRQQRDAEQIFRNLRKPGATAPELYPDEASDTGPQSVLRALPRPAWLDVSLDSQLLYTDNMRFKEVPAQRIESSVFVNTVQIALTPPPCVSACGSLAPRLGYRHQWFNYGLLEASAKNKNAFDFDSSTVFADETWTTGRWQVQLGCDWTRLLGHEPTYTTYNEFYNELVPRWSVQRVIPVCERSAFLIGYLGSFHFSQTAPISLFDRWEHTLLAAYSFALTRHLVVQPFYRYQLTEYTGQNREDQLHSVGGSLAWFFNERASVRLFTSYDLRQSSSRLAADYRKLDAGAGLNLNFKF